MVASVIVERVRARHVRMRVRIAPLRTAVRRGRFDELVAKGRGDGGGSEAPTNHRAAGRAPAGLRLETARRARASPRVRAFRQSRVNDEFRRAYDAHGKIIRPARRWHFLRSGVPRSRRKRLRVIREDHSKTWSAVGSHGQYRPQAVCGRYSARGFATRTRFRSAESDRSKPKL
jgi:hypothetical protein